MFVFYLRYLIIFKLHNNTSTLLIKIYIVYGIRLIIVSRDDLSYFAVRP